MLVAGPHPQGAVFGRIALQARPRPAVDDHSGAPTAPIGAPRPPFDRAQAAPAPGLARPIRDDGDLDTMLDGALGASGTVASAPQTRVPRVAPVTVEAPPRTSAPTASRPRNSASDKSDPDRQIYNKLVDAKRANGESTANLTFEQLQRNLDAARAKLMGKSGGRSIDFDVVVKDGKTILKPTVK